MLYRGSTHGWDPADFHKYCDNKGPTLSIIRVDNRWICAGYTSVSWTCNNVDVVDNSAYVLSVDKNTKYSYNG